MAQSSSEASHTWYWYAVSTEGFMDGRLTAEGLSFQVAALEGLAKTPASGLLRCREEYRTAALPSGVVQSLEAALLPDD